VAGKTLYLVDGSGFIFRAYHALPPMSRPDGVQVNAVYGFTNMLARLLSDAGAERVAVIFDVSRHSFRTELYPQYKAHRPPAPEDLIPQFALIREATRAFNVPAIELEGFEADDLIAAYAAAEVAEGGDVIIVSSDKDLMQLIRPGVSLLDPMKNKPIGAAEVLEKFGVPPEKVVDVQALMGDSTDNVPGVPGIGQKTAAELINLYGDLDTLLARAEEIKQPKRRQSLIEHAELARISRELVRLRADAPLPMALPELDKRAPDPEALKEFLVAQNFRSLLSKLLGPDGVKLAVARAAATPAPTVAPAPGSVTMPTPADAPRTYELVQTRDRLDHWIARAHAVGQVAFDTETSSLNATSADLVGISLAVAPGEACYIPLAHGTPGGQLDLGGDRPQQIPLIEALEALKPLLVDPSVLKIGQNLKYDMVVLEKYGVSITPYDDTMLLSYVLDGGKHGHGMDELAQRHLGITTISYEEVCGKGKKQIGFAEVALDRALAYAAEDADVTLRLHSVLKARLLLERQVHLYESIDRPIPTIITAMETTGALLDRNRLRELSTDFGQRMAVLESQIHEAAGEVFNIASPKQLGEILFGKLGLADQGKTSKTDNYSTSVDVLEDLRASHPVPGMVLDYRQLAKLKSTYADALVEQINPRTGRVHTSFALALTTTGRLSSSDPNLQNIPIRTEEGRNIREAFIAPEGHKLIAIDYSQIELRLLAEVAGIDTLKGAFAAGVDIHALTASQVFDVPLETMDKETRRKAKAINFGIIYGMSAFGLAQNIGVSQGQAQAFIRAYFERYPGIRAYMDRMKAFAKEHQFVETLFGRRCWVPTIADKNAARRSFAERQAINAPLQGTAADIMKRAMIKVSATLAATKLPAKMILTVHDELLFEVPDTHIDEAIATLRPVMENAAGSVVSVPLICEAGVGQTWASAH
jgi:DNA polymerase-1